MMSKTACVLAGVCLLLCLIQGSLAQQRGCGTYAIRGGDTFWKISQARGVSVQAIQDVNPGVVPEKLQIGQTINLPCAGDGHAPPAPAPPSRPAPATPAPVQGMDQAAMDIYNDMMRYRASRGLPSIPLCKHLNTVAAAHVADSNANPPRAPCNMHSWSQSSRWSGCCYTSGDSRASNCMWNKPRELSGYKGNGFEISHGAPNVRVSAKSAVDGWKGSAPHNDVMINAAGWKQPWQAVGVAISGGYAHVWFGNEPCPP